MSYTCVSTYYSGELLRGGLFGPTKFTALLSVRTELVSLTIFLIVYERPMIYSLLILEVNLSLVGRHDSMKETLLHRWSRISDVFSRFSLCPSIS